MMQILLNGDRRELPGPLSVRALLDSLAIDARAVAVEVNRAVIRRHDHDKTMVTDGAEVEIVSFVGGGAMRTRRLSSWIALFLVVGGSMASNGLTRAQTQTPPGQAPALTEETLVVYNGWAMLAAGDLAKAVSYAQAILNKYPSSIAGASLLVEAEIVRGGGEAGLGAYERWLGSRRLEDGYLLRRAARALLWDAASSPEVGVEALQYLTADGDLEARIRLGINMNNGNAADTRALARNGDEGAIRRLIDQIEKTPGKKMFQIQTLVESRSQLAIPTLTKLLGDKDPDHVGAAADGLGELGAKNAIPALRQLYQDGKNPLFVRFNAAAALYKLNDMSGLPLLQKQMALTEAPYVQLGPLRAMAPRAGGPPPDPTWLKTVRELSVNKDPAVRAQAAALVAPYDHELARQTLQRLISEGETAILEIAAKAMIESVATDFTTLRGLLRAPSALTRVRAANGILRLTR